MSTPFSLAPEQLWQAINPITAYQQGAQFGFINLDLGAAGWNPTSSGSFSTGSEAMGVSSAASATRLKSF
jgi:hypothetical protein